MGISFNMHIYNDSILGGLRQSSMEEFGYDLHRQHSGVWRSLRDGDFEEEDVWDVLRDRKDISTSSKFTKSSTSVPKNLHSAARMIPGAAAAATFSGSSSNSSHESKVVQQSAPVNIPDWSKVYRKKSKKASYDNNEDDYDDNDEGEDNGIANDGDNSDDEDDIDDSDYNYKLPTHELIAKRLARSQISSFSVFEGVGRTLKGRDLSKVRNAVLTKTGFLESL